MNSESPRKEFELPDVLQARLNVIIQTVPKFWESNRHYNHFTNHGPEHSERVHSQKLAQLSQELPEPRRLNPEEIFVVSAAAWLYEIGMQSPNLSPILDFEHQPGEHLSFSQLQEIRHKKHLLTRGLIIDSVRRDYKGKLLQLGLAPPADDYAHLISEVCRWCSDEPLKDVPESLPVRGIPVRVRLLVALLRLADQLYIDGSRVNLDLLERANLPIEELAKWWVYHYVQTLPITRGKIRFHYFLPSTQKQYLGHLRALILPRFEYRNNSVIQYLSDEHQLHLIPYRTPTFQFDQPDGFLREMKVEIIRFLRQEIDPVGTTIETLEPREEVEGRCLLVLDYESFVIQLGREGYHLTPNDLSHSVVTLLGEASRQHIGTVDALAIGHWNRPDLEETAEMLKGRIYELLTVEDQESVSHKLEAELTMRLRGPNAPNQVILVAPRQDLAVTVKKLAGGKHSVTAWISNLPDADIYRAVTKKPRSLRDVLQLEDAEVIELTELENSEAACILRIDDRIAGRGEKAIPLHELPNRLGEIALVDDQAYWWQLWLISQGRLAVEDTNQLPLVRLVLEHPNVVRVREMRKVVIEAFQDLSQDSEGVRQDLLTEELMQSPHFGCEERALDFLELLKEENTVFHKARLGSPEAQALWQLNASHWSVVLVSADSYLPRFTLALDHGLVRRGHSFADENRLLQYVSPHFREASTAEAIYDLAATRKWIRTRRPKRTGRSHIVHVMLNHNHVPAARTLRKRDIILNILENKAARTGIERDALWNKLSQIDSFALEQGEFDQWLTLLENDSVITVSKRGQSLGQDVLNLNLETRLTQRLLGRLYLPGLVRELRIMGATRPNKKKPVGNLLEKLTKYVTHHKRQLAEWVLDYARCIKLVEVEEGLVSLNRHSFVDRLDRREEQTCRAVAQLVQELASPDRDGWVPRYTIRHKMGDDIEQFGYTLGELDYWIDQAIHRQRLLEKSRERTKRGSRELVRVRARS